MSTAIPELARTPTPDVLTDERTETEDGPVAHIVKVGPGEDATAKVLDARINGTPIEALCGHVWVPARDPRQTGPTTARAGQRISALPHVPSPSADCTLPTTRRWAD